MAFEWLSKLNIKYMLDKVKTYIDGKISSLNSDLANKQDKSTAINTSNISYQSVKDANYLNGVGGRVASANVSDTNLRYILASSAMTTGKPPAESKILHMGWDWDAWHVQIAYPTDVNEFYFRYKTDSAWQNWATWYRNGVPDSGNDKKTTFAYSKAGLSYTDYTWLAAWNGYELRAVNKSHFAAANHSHSYLPLSGGNLTGTVNINGDCSYKLNNRAMFYTLGTTVFGLCANGGATVRRYDNPNTYAAIYASSFSQQSSRLVKENIHPITGEIAKKVLKLNVVSFDYIAEVGGDKNNVGLIAEDVLEIYPDCVTIPEDYSEEKAIKDIFEGKNINVLGLDYAKFTPYLIKMIQIQQKEIDSLKQSLNKLL